MKIYDCFTFFNELDLLTIRLHALNEVADYFVLVESNKTHSGKNKELIFKKNKHLFKEFLSKIIYVCVDDMPVIDKKGDRWILEKFQRRQIIRALQNCSSDDFVMISDIDEIPEAEKVCFAVKRLKRLNKLSDIAMGINKRLKKIIDFTSRNNTIINRVIRSFFFRVRKLLIHTSLIKFKHRMYQYYFNGFLHDKWIGTVICSYKILFGLLDGDTDLARTIYHGKYYHTIKGGWHFSFLGGVEKVIKKIKSFAHAEFDRNDINDKKRLSERIESGFNIFDKEGDEHRVTYIPLDDTFPQYLLTHQSKFKDKIKNIT